MLCLRHTHSFCSQLCIFNLPCSYPELIVHGRATLMIPMRVGGHNTLPNKSLICRLTSLTNLRQQVRHNGYCIAKLWEAVKLCLYNDIYSPCKGHMQSKCEWHTLYVYICCIIFVIWRRETLLTNKRASKKLSYPMRESVLNICKYMYMYISIYIHETSK